MRFEFVRYLTNAKRSALDHGCVGIATEAQSVQGLGGFLLRIPRDENPGLAPRLTRESRNSLICAGASSHFSTLGEVRKLAVVASISRARRCADLCSCISQLGRSLPVFLAPVFSGQGFRRLLVPKTVCLFRAERTQHQGSRRFVR